MPQDDREKLSEREIAELPKSDVDKIVRVCKAFEDMANAEAKHESQKKWRILFERAPEATLPFIIYVLYMGTAALAILFHLIDKTGEQLYIGAILLVVLMIAPLFVLPSESWKRLFRYLRNKLKGSNGH
jgi:hypothetical protein